MYIYGRSNSVTTTIIQVDIPYHFPSSVKPILTCHHRFVLCVRLMDTVKGIIRPVARAIGRDWTTRFPAVFLERCAALFMCEGKHAYITLQDSCVRPFTTRNSIRTVHRQTPVHPLTDATEGIHLSPESNRSHYTVSIGVVLRLSYCFVLAF